jgi:TPR repeat protein
MKLMNILAFGCLALIAGAGPALAQEPPRELEMIAHEAVEGDANAQLLYGLAYLEGRYKIKPDAKKAAYWLLRAARDGQPYAEMVTGNLYAEGKGVTKNPQQAVYWWRLSARAGIPAAQYKLGKARLEGAGVTKDPARAVHWLTKAAENGDHDAEFLLGKMYYEGYAVAQDKELGKDWLSRAAAHGHSDAINFLGVIEGMVKYTTMVYQQSADVLKQKAAAGDPQAQYELGLRYESGAWDVVKDDKQALHWLTEAANNGNHHAMATLAHIYARGELGVKPDPKQAAYWRDKSHLK